MSCFRPDPSAEPLPAPSPVAEAFPSAANHSATTGVAGSGSELLALLASPGVSRILLGGGCCGPAAKRVAAEHWRMWAAGVLFGSCRQCCAHPAPWQGTAQKPTCNVHHVLPASVSHDAAHIDLHTVDWQSYKLPLVLSARNVLVESSDDLPKGAPRK